MYALKDATGVFMDFIAEVDTSDRVALVVYNAPNGNALLESNFTDDLDSIANIVDHRQAGHYHEYTNIGAGLQLGRQTMDGPRPAQRQQADRADDRRPGQLAQRPGGRGWRGPDDRR